MKNQLPKSVSIVVGSSRGLGLAVLESLSERDRVIGFSRNQPRLSEITAATEYVCGDITKDRDRKSLFDYLLNHSLKVSKLVFCNALHGDKSGSQWEPNYFLAYMESNCFSVIRMFSLLELAFCATGCSVVLLGSAISQGSANQPAYAMSKAALQSWMKSYTLAQSSDSKVCVNMLWPGRINTESNPKRDLPTGDLNMFREPEEVAKYVVEMLNWGPTGPRGQVIDLGR